MSRIYKVLLQPLWLWLWQNTMTKYCTELQWEKGKEHSVNQGLLHRIGQKNHELYLLLPSLQPNNISNSFFLGARNNIRLNELKVRENTAQGSPNCDYVNLVELSSFLKEYIFPELQSISWAYIGAPQWCSYKTELLVNTSNALTTSLS